MQIWGSHLLQWQCRAIWLPTFSAWINICGRTLEVSRRDLKAQIKDFSGWSGLYGILGRSGLGTARRGRQLYLLMRFGHPRPRGEPLPAMMPQVLNTLSRYVMKQLFRCQGFTPRKVAEPVSILQGATSPKPFFGAGLPLLIWIHVVFPFGKHQPGPVPSYSYPSLVFPQLLGVSIVNIFATGQRFGVLYSHTGYPILLWPHRWAFVSSPGHLVEYLEARDTVVVSQTIAVLRN